MCVCVCGGGLVGGTGGSCRNRDMVSMLMSGPNMRQARATVVKVYLMFFRFGVGIRGFQGGGPDQGHQVSGE